MIKAQTVAAFVAGLAFAVVPSLIIAQTGAPAATPAKPPKASVGIFHVAPGKQVDFLKWQAAREAVAKEVGVPAAQWYAHLEGDSWDYVVVAPFLTEADDAKIEAAEKKKGLKTGPQSGIEFRKMIASHTDTLVAGPMTAQQILDAVK